MADVKTLRHILEGLIHDLVRAPNVVVQQRRWYLRKLATYYYRIVSTNSASSSTSETGDETAKLDWNAFIAEQSRTVANPLSVVNVRSFISLDASSQPLASNSSSSSVVAAAPAQSSPQLQPPVSAPKPETSAEPVQRPTARNRPAKRQRTTKATKRSPTPILTPPRQQKVAEADAPPTSLPLRRSARVRERQA